MKLPFRASAVLAAAALALLAGAGGVQADGPRTSKSVKAAIAAQPWKTLEVGDREYRVASVRCFLDEFGYFNRGCDPDADLGDLFPARMVAPVERYQRSKPIPDTGKVDQPTWEALRGDLGRSARGDRRRDLVRGLQYSLKVLQRPSLDVDGLFGPVTARTVAEFQRRKNIDPDGIVGPITFQALFAVGAEQESTPRPRIRY